MSCSRVGYTLKADWACQNCTPRYMLMISGLGGATFGTTLSYRLAVMFGAAIAGKCWTKNSAETLEEDK